MRIPVVARTHRFATLHVRRATLLLCLLLGPSPLQAAKDAARGSTLWNTTYHCTDCHAQTSMADVVTEGSTVRGLLDAIQTVPTMRSTYLSTLGQNATDVADIAAYLASIVASTRGPDLDQQGLTGSWYEPAESGQGIEVEFYPDLVAPGTSLVSGAWFTFDAGAQGGPERQRWYVFGGNGARGAASIPVTIGQNVGGNFAEPPATTPAVVGSGTLSFSDCTNATLRYALNDGRSGSAPMTRITPNVTCVMSGVAPTNADFALSGNWYDPATSGQGFVLEVNPLAAIAFFAWYTYAQDGQAAGAAGQRWYTGQGAFAPGSRSIALTLGETTGGVFDQPTPAAQKTVAVGSATLTFASCATAELRYTFTGGSSAGRSGTLSLQRVGPVPTGCGP